GKDEHDAKGATQEDRIENNLKMPQRGRSSLARDNNTADQGRFSVEGIYTKTIHALRFQQGNLVDHPVYNEAKAKHHLQP
ncbi:hypothetical protein, partial [Chitinophaga sp. GbtcB8]|uniref:hypothetical protein n=1 Tax=Chitinophaga sp. GbtcB8 TaxID=2824753 RepID=UPI001C2F4B11